VQQIQPTESKNHLSFTVFLGNLPAWVTADDIKQWLAAEDLVADAVKVIRNHETQESKGFAFVEAPTADEMASIIRRFDRAPLEDRLLRANPAQPPKGKEPPRGQQQPVGAAAPGVNRPQQQAQPQQQPQQQQRPDRRKRGGARDREQSPRSAFATELAKVL
jgi:RNA recognition motif-containing protein